MVDGLSIGKWQRLRSLADEQGRFKMMAIDQRDSLRHALAKAIGREPQQVSAADMTQAKAVITKMLAPYAAAILTDPVMAIHNQAVYALADVRTFCHELNEAAAVPWAILSAGVDRGVSSANGPGHGGRG